MKKFKNVKTFKPFERSKMTKEQIHQAKGGLYVRTYASGTGSTRSCCHVDGTDDGDNYFSN